MKGEDENEGHMGEEERGRKKGRGKQTLVPNKGKDRSSGLKRRQG